MKKTASASRPPSAATPHPDQAGRSTPRPRQSYPASSRCSLPRAGRAFEVASDTRAVTAAVRPHSRSAGVAVHDAPRRVPLIQAVVLAESGVHPQGDLRIRPRTMQRVADVQDDHRRAVEDWPSGCARPAAASVADRTPRPEPVRQTAPGESSCSAWTRANSGHACRRVARLPAEQPHSAPPAVASKFAMARLQTTVLNPARRVRTAYAASVAHKSAASGPPMDEIAHHFAPTSATGARHTR